jgi:hypothetical protein
LESIVRELAGICQELCESAIGGCISPSWAKLLLYIDQGSITYYYQQHLQNSRMMNGQEKGLAAPRAATSVGHAV